MAVHQHSHDWIPPRRVHGVTSTPKVAMFSYAEALYSIYNYLTFDRSSMAVFCIERYKIRSIAGYYLPHSVKHRSLTSTSTSVEWPMLPFLWTLELISSFFAILVGQSGT